MALGWWTFVAASGVDRTGGDICAWFPLVEKGKGLLAPVWGILAVQWEDLATYLPVSRPRGRVMGLWMHVPLDWGPRHVPCDAETSRRGWSWGLEVGSRIRTLRADWGIPPSPLPSL